MSRVIFDYLLDSPLLDQAELADNYRRLSDQELTRELDRYRAHVLDNLVLIREEVPRPEDHLSAYFGATAATSQWSSPADSAIKAALYFDSVVLDDPIFKATAETPEGSNAAATFLGYKSAKELDREKLAAAAERLRLLQPLIGSDILKLAPISLAHEPPKHMGLSISDNLFAERVPESLRAWFHERAVVHPMFPRDEGGWAYRADDELRPTRGIAVTFRGHDRPMIFNLTAMRMEPDPDNPEVFKLIQWLPDEPPDDRQFALWVTQAIHQHAGHLYEITASDLMNAAATGTMLMTDSPFLGDLLSIGLTDGGQVERDLAQLAMTFELPFFKDLSLTDLVAVRQNESAAFQKYRRDLQSHLIALRGLGDPEEIRRKMADVEREFEEVQLREVEEAVRKARRGGLAKAAVGAATLATSVASGGLSLGTALLGVALATEGGIDYRDKIRGHPAYFLWKLRRKAN